MLCTVMSMVVVGESARVVVGNAAAGAVYASFDASHVRACSQRSLVRKIPAFAFKGMIESYS